MIGVYRAEDGEVIYVTVGRTTEGTSSTRPETGALALALTDTRNTRLPMNYTGDSKNLRINVHNWIGEGKSKSLAQYPIWGILREVLTGLQCRMELELPTIFVKIRSHHSPQVEENSSMNTLDINISLDSALVLWNNLFSLEKRMNEEPPNDEPTCQEIDAAQSGPIRMST